MTSTGKRHRNSALPNATGDDHDVYAGKLQACRFFFAEEEVGRSGHPRLQIESWMP
jgi:hypothetical protein